MDEEFHGIPSCSSTLTSIKFIHSGISRDLQWEIPMGACPFSSRPLKYFETGKNGYPVPQYLDIEHRERKPWFCSTSYTNRLIPWQRWNHGKSFAQPVERPPVVNPRNAMLSVECNFCTSNVILKRLWIDGHLDFTNSFQNVCKYLEMPSISLINFINQQKLNDAKEDTKKFKSLLTISGRLVTSANRKNYASKNHPSPNRHLWIVGKPGVVGKLKIIAFTSMQVQASARTTWPT